MFFGSFRGLCVGVVVGAGSAVFRGIVVVSGARLTRALGGLGNGDRTVALRAVCASFRFAGRALLHLIAAPFWGRSLLCFGHADKMITPGRVPKTRRP